MTGKEIQEAHRPFSNRLEANRTILGKKIIKRPGVFSDDRKEVYSVIDTTDKAVIFENWKGERKQYAFDNILLDYLFEDGTVIGIKR